MLAARRAEDHPHADLRRPLAHDRRRARRTGRLPASSTATAAKMPISVVVKRIGAIALSTNAVIGCTSASGARGSICAHRRANGRDDLIRIAGWCAPPTRRRAVTEMAVGDEDRFRPVDGQRGVPLVRDDADHLVPFRLRRRDPRQQPLARPPGRRGNASAASMSSMIICFGWFGLLIDALLSASVNVRPAIRRVRSVSK